jgi:hypothetical protein
MTTEEVVQMLQAAVKQAGSQEAWARRHGCAIGRVGEVVRGRRDPDDRILAGLGLRRVVTYEPIETEA